MLQKSRFAACFAMLSVLPMSGCMLATNGLIYDNPEVPAPPPPPPPAPMPMPMPPPPPPCQMNSVGVCKTGDKVVLTGVNFDFNKSTLTLNAKALLDPVAASLKSSTVKVEIGGYTDSKGSDAYNEKLSLARANSVKAYLHAKGVEASKMTTSGYGSAMPIADNSTDEGRELNRRVELKVLEGGM